MVQPPDKSQLMPLDVQRGQLPVPARQMSSLMAEPSIYDRLNPLSHAHAGASGM